MVRDPRRKLFVYGTLRDPQIRGRVLGPIPEAWPAVLRGYELRAADGFYFVRRAEGCHVVGEALELDASQLARADRWEEIPTYQRVSVRVETNGFQCEAWVYQRSGVEGCVVRDPGIAVSSRDEILELLDRES